MPLFPLGATALMPHQALPLRVFEPRYRQMVERTLDGPGQIAMATYAEDLADHAGGDESIAPPMPGLRALKPAVCVGQIEQHARLPDGNYAVILRGICRARILHEMPFEAEEGVGVGGMGEHEIRAARLYRVAMLEPVGVEQQDEGALASYRKRLGQALGHTPLNTLRNAEGLSEHLLGDQVPSSALIEMIGLSYVSDDKTRYELLATGSAEKRAQILINVLADLEGLLKKAMPQVLVRAKDPKSSVYLN